MSATYVEPHMSASLADHELTTLDGGKSFRMGQPGTGIFAIHMIEVGNRLCITGDISLGANGHGVVSAPGYTFGWLGSQLSEGYLCEKFLRGNEWQWEAAVEAIQQQIELEDAVDWWAERTDKLKAFIAAPDWTYGEPTIHEFHEFMSELGDDCCDLPGYDYPRIQAGWLCAIQQRFREMLIANVTYR